MQFVFAKLSLTRSKQPCTFLLKVKTNRLCDSVTLDFYSSVLDPLFQPKFSMADNWMSPKESQFVSVVKGEGNQENDRTRGKERTKGCLNNVKLNVEPCVSQVK